MRLRRLLRISLIVSASFFFIVGIILIIAAIATNPNNVTCNGQIMNRGDICIHSINGAETSRNTLDQQRQSLQSRRIVEIIGALLCFGAGTFFILRFNKARVALKNSTLDTASQPDDLQEAETETEADPLPQNTYLQESGVLPSLPSRAPQQTGTYPSLLTGTFPALPSRAPQQTGTYPSLLTGKFPALPGRAPQQTGTHPSLPGDDTQQPGAFPPPQGDSSQHRIPAQPGSYRLTPNDSTQSGTYPPPPMPSSDS